MQGLSIHNGADWKFVWVVEKTNLVKLTYLPDLKISDTRRGRGDKINKSEKPVKIKVPLRYRRVESDLLVECLLDNWDEYEDLIN